MTTNEQYRALTEQAGIGAVAARHPLSVAGGDRASFLHGLLSNEVRTLTAGTGCYAAWLTPQGRMITDVHVFETGDSMLLDVPVEVADAALQRLDQSLFSEDVQLADLGPGLTSLWIHGPRAAQMIGTAVPDAARDALGLDEWTEYTHRVFSFAGTAMRIARVSQLGVPGFCLYVEHGVAASLREALERAGAIPVDAAAIDAARIEAGYPVFGIDMTTDTIPLEAGIEDRAISFTKGCYVGQEVIVRVMHRGGGRVARRLMGLRFEEGPPPPGDRLFGAGKDIGWVTSAARSPRTGAIGLGYVQRDSAVAGTRLTVGAAGACVVVSERPILSSDGR